MSRSNPSSRGSSLPNPAKYYFQWRDSKISFWDKEAKKNVEFPTMKFIVLDELHSAGGYSNKNQTGIRGTEVKDIKNEPLTIYMGDKKVAEGLWEDVKNTVPDIKYAKNVYIAVINKSKPMEIAKLTLSGASFGAWLSFRDGKEDYDGNGAVDFYGPNVGVAIVGKSKIKKKGKVEYHEPLYETFEITDAQAAEALALDEQLQDYFKSRGGGSSVEGKGTTAYEIVDTTDEGFPDNASRPDDVDDLPF